MVWITVSRAIELLYHMLVKMCYVACPADSRRRFNLNMLEYIQLKKARTGEVTVPPYEGEPKPESEPRLKTPEKRLVSTLVQ